MLEQSVLKHFVDDFQPFNWSVVKKMQNNNNLWFVTEVPVLKLGSNRLAPGAVSNRNHYHDSWLNSSDCSLQESHKDAHIGSENKPVTGQEVLVQFYRAQRPGSFHSDLVQNTEDFGPQT